MRTHEYGEAAGDERLDAAVKRVLLLRAGSGGTGAVALEKLASAVVAELLCSCVTDAEDAAEARLSDIHAALIAEVVRRVRLVLGSATEVSGAGPDAVVWPGTSGFSDEGALQSMKKVRG